MEARAGRELRESITKQLRDGGLSAVNASTISTVTALVPEVAREFNRVLAGEKPAEPVAIRGYTASELTDSYQLSREKAYEVLAWLRVETASAQNWLDSRKHELRTGRPQYSDLAYPGYTG